MACSVVAPAEATSPPPGLSPCLYLSNGYSLSRQAVYPPSALPWVPGVVEIGIGTHTPTTISSTTELRTAAAPILHLICIYIQLGMSCYFDPVLLRIVIFYNHHLAIRSLGPE